MNIKDRIIKKYTPVTYILKNLNANDYKLSMGQRIINLYRILIYKLYNKAFSAIERRRHTLEYMANNTFNHNEEFYLTDVANVLGTIGGGKYFKNTQHFLINKTNTKAITISMSYPYSTEDGVFRQLVLEGQDEI